MPKIHEGGGIEDAEGIGFVGAEMAASAHEDAGLVLSFFHPFGAAGLDIDGHDEKSAINLEEGFDRHVGEVVLGLAEDGAEGFGDAHDGEGAAVNPDFTADGINIREKLGGEIVADHGGHGAVLVVAIGDVAALDGHLDINVADAGRDAANIGVFDALRADTDFAGGANFGADTEGELEIVVEGLVVLPGDDFVAAGCFDVFLDIGEDGEASDEKAVGAEIGDAIGDVAVDTGDEGNDEDEGGNGDDDAEEHEEGTELVGANGLERHTDGFTKRKATEHAGMSLPGITPEKGESFKSEEGYKRSDIRDQEARDERRNSKNVVGGKTGCGVPRSLHCAARRATNRREGKNRAAPAGMTVLGGGGNREDVKE